MTYLNYNLLTMRLKLKILCINTFLDRYYYFATECKIKNVCCGHSKLKKKIRPFWCVWRYNLKLKKPDKWRRIAKVCKGRVKLYFNNKSIRMKNDSGLYKYLQSSNSKYFYARRLTVCFLSDSIINVQHHGKFTFSRTAAELTLNL